VVSVDLDAPLDELGAAQRRLRAAQLAAIHTAVIAGEWARAGHRSPAHWLAHRTGDPISTCRATIHLAERLHRLPVLADALATARLNEARIRLLANAWSPTAADAFTRDQDQLIGYAEHLAYHDLCAVINHWISRADPERAERNHRHGYDARRLHLSHISDGMGVIDGLLDAEGFAEVHAAIEMLARPTTTGETRTPAQRRADALVMMARHTTTTHPGLTGVIRRRRPKVNIVIHLDDLIQRTGTATLFSTLDPTPSPLSADAARRLTCDAGIHRLITDPASNILDYGRRRRTVSEPLFEALALRSGHCDFPTCDIPAAFTDAHHATHWTQDGPTNPDNLVLGCWHHHHLVHEGNWTVTAHGNGHFTWHPPNPDTPPLTTHHPGPLQL
jgi:hypothetical protein